MRAQFIEPMLASLVEQPPDGEEWIHEIKHDGYRTLLALEDGKVQAFTRRGADWTATYHVADVPCGADSAPYGFELQPVPIRH